ncbi:hypothetical protein GCM10010129_82230 [Streptomyces fumigatiscleroticus]|nr:hypothetical protein GCM10010129_82230 [Streptomyces fumigatiscleroticus]
MMYSGGLAARAQEARTFHYSRNQLRVVLACTTGSSYLSKSVCLLVAQRPRV